MYKYINIILFLCFSFAAQADESVLCSEKECYTMVNELGEGAFGKVFAATNGEGFPFAIKAYKHDWQPTGVISVYNDAQREFQRGQMLNHPNIVKSYELFKSQAIPNFSTYLVLSFVKGQILYETKPKSLTRDQTVNALNQFVDALRHAYSMGLFHLDLHAGNVMLTDTSDIVVIDLASFFTIQEIYPPAEANNALMAFDMGGHAPANEGIKEVKLKDFFLRHPELKVQPQINRVLNKPMFAADGMPEMDYTLYDQTTPPFLSVYFQDVINICEHIVTKSKMDRNEKIELRLNLRRFALEYLEDAQEKLDVPIENYFDQLAQLLTPAPSFALGVNRQGH